MGLHPQARALLDQIAQTGLPPLYELSPEDARAQAARLRRAAGPGPDIAYVQNFALPTAAGEIAARRYAAEDSAGTILWLHGGGWVVGDLDSHDAMCRRLAIASGCRVFAIDYRRAPEHPFPAPLEDSWDALLWVTDTYASKPLILGGDSAGANMAAVLAARARDRGGPELALQVLVYPITDHVTTTTSYVQHGSGPDTYLTTAEMTWCWDCYVPSPAARDNPEVSPLRAPDLSALPPAIVLTAEYDPLRDEAIAYAERLRAAGVPVTHHHYDDMIHAFFSLGNLIERGDEAVAQVGGEIRSTVAQSIAHA